MQMNLNTTLKAYPKISPSILKDYVTEAPADGKTYGRKNKQWVPIMDNTILVYFGASTEEIMTSDILENLSKKALPTDTNSTGVIIANNEPSYLWLCSTFPVESITFLNAVADYTQQEQAVDIMNNEVTYTFYCYMIDGLMEPSQYGFRMIFHGDKE